MENKFGKSDMITGENLGLVLEGKSDFVEKYGGEKKTELAMMFNAHDCDLYDNVRPITWTDPTNVSVLF